jgi:hypothetical protein
MAQATIPRRMVDERAVQTNQVAIVALVAVAFVLGFGPGRWLIGFVGLSLALGAAAPGYGPFQLFYRHALNRFGLVKPAPQPGDPAPHRFAQSLGAVFLLASAILLFAGATTAGTVLALIVTALALVNLVFHFCAGCFLFLQIARFREQPRAAS